MTSPRPFTRSLPVLAAAAMLMAGCTVGPDYHRPDLKLTAAYVAAPSGPPAPGQLGDGWWAAFGDPGLTRVVERAQAQNLDLEQARARLLQSRAAARAAGAALLPQAPTGAAVADERQSLLSPVGDLAQHLPGFERDLDVYDVGAAASWEIDLFGGLRRQRDAAVADARAAHAQADAVRLSIAAEAADAYLQVRAAQGRLAVARRQEGVEQDLVALLTRRSNDGVSSERELHAGQAALEGVRASIPPLSAALDAELNRLDVLMGAQPGTWRAELQAAAPMPAPPVIAAGDGPADLLRRRPDVAAAEQRLIAADARIGAAIADYYPKLSISGLLGVESIDSSRLFVADAVQHQVGAGLSWRLFDFGRVGAEVAGARGGEAEALAAYRAAVLHAAEEVEDSFSDLRQQQLRAAALSRQIDQLTLARRQAQDAYASGAVSLIEVRDADRDLLTASDQLVQAQAGAARAAVAACRALGGGWTAPTA